MPPLLAASQPARTSGRITRPVLRYDPASQPAGIRAISPPPAPVRLELNGIGEEEAIVELEDLEQGGEVDEEVAGGGQVGANDEEFDANIEGRCRPHIPQGDPMARRAPDSDGWSFIAKLGAYECFLTCFPSLQEVPNQREEAWADAVAEVLRRRERAISDWETRLALCWWLFLPQALLRRPSRGGRAGRQQVAKRFGCLSRGDWGGLIGLWEQDQTILA